MSDIPNDVTDLIADMPRDVPVLGTEPVKPKKRRKRKANPAAPKVVRAPKIKPDPIRDAFEASKASATTPPIAMDAQPLGEAPAPSIVQGVGALDRQERYAQVFDASAPPNHRAPRINSTWGQRFILGLRAMAGIDGDAQPVRFSTTVTIFLCFAIVGAAAGVARAVL